MCAGQRFPTIIIVIGDVSYGGRILLQRSVPGPMEGGWRFSADCDLFRARQLAGPWTYFQVFSPKHPLDIEIGRHQGQR